MTSLTKRSIPLAALIAIIVVATFMLPAVAGMAFFAFTVLMAILAVEAHRDGDAPQVIIFTLATILLAIAALAAFGAAK